MQKPIVEFPGYFVTELGEVWGPGRYGSAVCLRPIPVRGYPRVRLYRDGKGCWKLVHRLVMEAHGSPPPTSDHTQVDHLDGDRANCHISNLEWVTASENIRRAHAARNGPHPLKGVLRSEGLPCIDCGGVRYRNKSGRPHTRCKLCLAAYHRKYIRPQDRVK